MKLIFVSFTGQFDHQGDYMKNCCHFLNQFIFVSLFVYFCLCCFICLFVGVVILKWACFFFYESKPRYLPKRMFHLMVRMFVADHLFVTL